MSHDRTALEDLERKDQLWVLRALHDETVGGMLLAGAAVIALVWANSPWSSGYRAIVEADLTIGGLQLSVAHWAADALLAVFFLVVGIELKHEFTVGSLSSLRLAAAPIAGAVGGMMCAALLFVVIADQSERGSWGIPVSTDVAFALAVLALAGRMLSVELRAFLLTLAVVNDLGAIAIIALWYGGQLDAGWVLSTTLCVGAVWWLQHTVSTRTRRVGGLVLPTVYTALALGAWYSCYRAGIHPTVAGAMLGFALRTRLRDGESLPPGERLLQQLRPLSAGLCVPLFAFTAAGLAIDGAAMGGLLSDRLVLAILVGLVVGQPLGVTAGTYLAIRLTGGRLNPALTWWDIAVVGTLAAIGFTVALLVVGVSFAGDTSRLTVATAGVLVTNAVAVAVAVIAVRLRAGAVARSRRAAVQQ